MRLIIVGATGKIGQSLVPELINCGHQLLVVGRSKKKSVTFFPDVTYCPYNDLRIIADRYDAVINLAVLNNKEIATWNDFKKVNVDLPLSLLPVVEKTSMKLFITVSSVNALDMSDQSKYAKSKRLMHEELSRVKTVNKATYYLAYTYSPSAWQGSLAFINKLPKSLQKPSIKIINVFWPVLNYKELADRINNLKCPEFDRILADGQYQNALFNVIKRSVDIIISAVASILCILIFPIVGLLIKLSSQGPVFFKQKRVGKNGKTFICYKFRTMRYGVEQTPTHLSNKDNITAFGHFLRRTKIDELPQAINVLKNEMSVVGPRPSLTSQKSLIHSRSINNLLTLKPGITGLAQVNGVDMSDTQKLVSHDLAYMKLQTLTLDLKILLKTFRFANIRLTIPKDIINH